MVTLTLWGATWIAGMIGLAVAIVDHGHDY